MTRGQTLAPMSPELLAATDDDLEFLYYLAAEVEPAWLRVSKAGVPLPDRFLASIARDVLRQYVIVDDASRLLGAAAIHGASERHRSAWVEVVISPDCSDRIGTERVAFDRLLTESFDGLGMRFVYAQTAEWAPPVIDDRWHPASIGTLTEALLHQDRHWSIGITQVAAPGSDPQ